MTVFCPYVEWASLQSKWIPSCLLFTRQPQGTKGYYSCVANVYSYTRPVYFRFSFYQVQNHVANIIIMQHHNATPQVLKLLKIAWERRLTFTIGTSVTTGAMDTVVWNEIHHKTESTSNYSGHGYPDPNYLDNVLMELSLQGVEDPDSAAASSTSDDSL